jgi:hypothetical protein
MEMLRRLIGGPSLKEIDARSKAVQKDHHAKLNKMTPWERERWFVENQRRAWRDDDPQEAH